MNFVVTPHQQSDRPIEIQAEGPHSEFTVFEVETGERISAHLTSWEAYQLAVKLLEAAAQVGTRAQAARIRAALETL